MPASKPALLIVHRRLGMLTPFLESDFAVWRFWEGPPVEAVNAIEALVVGGDEPLDKALAEALPKLGLIACFAAEVGGIDLAWARARGLKVSHAPGIDREDVADHAVGLMLAAWRRIVAGDERVRRGRWTAGDHPLTLSLAGRRLGVVGLGAVGEAVARRAAAFGLGVAWWGPREKPDAPWPRTASLLDLAVESDILVVACTAGAETHGLISRPVIEALGPRGLLVNIAHGEAIDEDALIEALTAGALGMAALDVYRDEPAPPDRWVSVPNVVLTPHIAGATTAAVPAMVALTLENLRRHFAGEPLANPLGA